METKFSPFRFRIFAVTIQPTTEYPLHNCRGSVGYIFNNSPETPTEPRQLWSGFLWFTHMPLYSQTDTFGPVAIITCILRFSRSVSICDGIDGIASVSKIDSTNTPENV